MNSIDLKEFKEIFNYFLDNNKRLISEGKNPIAIGCEGESGIGKTSILKQIAQERNMTFVKLNLAELDEVGD